MDFVRRRWESTSRRPERSNKDKLDKEIKKKRPVVETGKVDDHDLGFDRQPIEVELDGAARTRRVSSDRVQVGVGSGNSTIRFRGTIRPRKAKGSKSFCGSQRKFLPICLPRG